MGNNIITFLKSRTFIIIVAVILLISLFSIKQCQRKVLIEKINTLEMSNFALNNDRISLEFQLKKLTIDFSNIELRNDSLKKVLNKYQDNLIKLKKEHEKQIAELLKIPTDTVYIRLGAIYTNFDGDILKYPFSGSQIRQIYSTAISYDMVQKEYTLQGKSLSSCLLLNDGFENGIANLEKQITNLQSNVDKADLQIKNYNKEVGVLNRQVAKRGFWNKALAGGGIVAVVIAILK